MPVIKTKNCPVKGCKVQHPVARLMCAAHWALVPRELQSEVWRYFRPGQLKSGMASPMYMEAARNAIERAEREERVAAACGIKTQLHLL